MIVSLVVIGIAVLACLMFGLGWYAQSQQRDDEYAALLERNVQIYSDLQDTKNDSIQSNYHLARIREALKSTGVDEERLIAGKYRLRAKQLPKPS